LPSIFIFIKMNNALLYNVGLTMLPNVGSILAQNLIAYCGSAEAVFKASKGKLLKVPLVGDERADAIVKSEVLRQAEQELKFIEDNKITPLFFTEEAFPKRLKECNDAPILLYYQGNADLNTQKIVAIVGTRKISEYGKEITKKFIQELAAQDVLVISGLAYGVDIAAHTAALDNGLKTVGVLGHGLNRMYPNQHKPTAKKMIEQGGLLTEFTSQDAFAPHNFPQRNRIVAGMCDACVVIESAKEGGAVITANIANSYNKDVFALPGRVNDKYSSGCNFLIKTYKANLIESGKDLLDAMLWNEGELKPKKQKQLSLILSDKEQLVYSILQQHTELEIDRLVLETKLDAGSMAAILLEMEMNEIVLSLPGKRYKLLG
jgi:DNA processing protein